MDLLNRRADPWDIRGSSRLPWTLYGLYYCWLQHSVNRSIIALVGLRNPSRRPERVGTPSPESHPPQHGREPGCHCQWRPESRICC